MRRNKILLLVSSLATLVVLGAAAWQENVDREWRRLQNDYASRLAPDLASGFEIKLRQVVAPKVGAMDRCVSCHVGMAPGESAIEGHEVFGKHPDVAHDTADFGCVTCHAGQGRATDKAEAHGTAPHWPLPMIPARFASAGCGSCHTHLEVPHRDTLARGRAVFERSDCLACHGLDGRGGTIRPGGAAGIAGGDLSRVGIRGWKADWYSGHLAEYEKATTGPWRSSFGPIDDADREALAVFLGSRAGAPGLLEAKSLFHSLGCRGCHKVGGVGGDDGPDLTRIGEKDPGRIDFSRVPGPRSLDAWFAEHFRAPAAVVPGSAMPALGLGDDEIERLTFYMLALRRGDFAEALWPTDRLRAERFGEREFATDGETLFGTFCASCHGPRGEGMRYAGMPAFPAIANPDFLEIADDRFIAATVTHGRPGRRMPAWGESEGGLRPSEIVSVVSFLRTMGGTPALPDPKPARWAAGDAPAGGVAYASSCASCHGDRGEGKEGPSLANPVLLRSASDTYLFETIRRGRRGTSMPAFATASVTHRALSDPEIENVVTFIRGWEAQR